MPALLNLVRPARSADTGVLNVASYGGSYGEAFRKAWLDPFQEETGIKVNLGANASLSLVKLQQDNPSGSEWDIVDLFTSEYYLAVSQNLLAPLDPSTVDVSQILPEYVKSHGFGYALYIWARGYNKSAVAESHIPESWREFWEVGKIPGRRSLASGDGQTLEAALLADGVPIGEIYPLDVDRAFRSLDRLGKGNILWANTYQEPVQHLISGEVPLAGIYTGRAIIANRDGADIGLSAKEGLVSGDFISVVQNARNKKEAFQLMNYMATRGDRAAEFTALTSYAVPHADVERLLPANANDVRALLPTNPDLRDNLLVSDADWWIANLESVKARFLEWQVQ
ncbi:ABC transporter substrate-binding protein [Mesorhizobium sp. L-8-10]|nr:ABC transporter substrate-binding protein [Mesorhizobium sp. L-8-10]